MWYTYCWSVMDSPCQHLRKCIENSMENMHTDVRLCRLINIFLFMLVFRDVHCSDGSMCCSWEQARGPGPDMCGVVGGKECQSQCIWQVSGLIKLQYLLSLYDWQCCVWSRYWFIALFFFFFLCVFMEHAFVLAHRSAKKITQPISSHLDFLLG